MFSEALCDAPVDSAPPACDQRHLAIEYSLTESAAQVFSVDSVLVCAFARRLRRTTGLRLASSENISIAAARDAFSSTARLSARSTPLSPGVSLSNPALRSSPT